ncbi:Hypothetical protein P9303_25611 [Prochlorococcus marinus str. MIT 9303]|uniref:Uncharacterized protein n=1 Tax=Prochlorococcus marinus (strain MIT 9303) TaxID=59922 RepID=A2CCT2_PROM3|nr:Hypothetical protein P9303_25611 [Prochlorococcus marinus str. MIT 9303]
MAYEQSIATYRNPQRALSCTTAVLNKESNAALPMPTSNTATRKKPSPTTSLPHFEAPLQSLPDGINHTTQRSLSTNPTP